MRNGVVIGGWRERRRCDDRAADRIAAALALIRQTDERWHGLAVWLSRAGMDRDAELLNRLVRSDLWLIQNRLLETCPPDTNKSRMDYLIILLR